MRAEQPRKIHPFGQPGSAQNAVLRFSNRRIHFDWPLPDTEIAPALAQMFAKAGIEMDKGEDGEPVVIGVALKEA